MIDQIITLLYSALFFITPLIMTKSTSELFEFNKMLFIYGSTVLIAFFWFSKMVINKKIILKKTFLDIPILIFFLSQIISTIFSIDQHASIFGYYGRFNGGLLSIFSYIILYFGFISNNVNVDKILKTILASSLVVIIWAVPGHFGRDLTCLLFTGTFSNTCWDNTTLAFRPELRAFSTLGQPNWLGAYLAVAFFIGIYFLIKNISRVETQNFASLRIRIFTSIYLFLNFSMILMSRSRSAIGAVIVGLILFVGYYFFFVKSNFKKVLIILLAVTVIPILFFKTGEDKIDKYLDLKNLSSTFQHQKPTVNPPSSIVQSNNVTESFDIRKIVWEGAWKLALKYPLFGTGVETFAYSYYFVRPVAHNLTSEWDYVYNKAHNEYFNYLATTGFVGLGSYLILILVFIFYYLGVIPAKAGIQKSWIPFFKGMTKPSNSSIEQLNNRKMLTVCLLVAYLTILITNFFGFSTTTIQLFFFLIPAFVISFTDPTNLTDLTKGSTQRSTPTSTNILQKIFIFLLVSSTIYLLFSISVYYLADINYSLGLKYSKVNDQQKATVYFEKALKLRAEPVYMDKFSASLAYLSAVASIQNQRELAKQIADVSDSYNRKTINDYPENVFYWKTRAKNMYYFFQINLDIERLNEGIKALQTAEKLSPTDPKIPYSLALYYSLIYDQSKEPAVKETAKQASIFEIDKSIRLKSNYQEAFTLREELLKKYHLYKDGP